MRIENTNTHNATKYKTRVGTFQLKYSNGGNLGSYSMKLKDFLATQPKKPYVWHVTAQELVFMVLRANAPNNRTNHINLLLYKLYGSQKSK